MVCGYTVACPTIDAETLGTLSHIFHLRLSLMAQLLQCQGQTARFQRCEVKSVKKCTLPWLSPGECYICVLIKTLVFAYFFRLTERTALEDVVLGFDSLTLLFFLLLLLVDFFFEREFLPVSLTVACCSSCAVTSSFPSLAAITIFSS